jgi:hypothetical protein
MISAAGIVIFGDLDEQGRPPRQAAMSELRPGNPVITPLPDLLRFAMATYSIFLKLASPGIHLANLGLTISLKASGAPVSLTKQPVLRHCRRAGRSLR